MLTLYQNAEPGNGWIVPIMALALIVSSFVGGHILQRAADVVFYGETRIDRFVQALPDAFGACLGLALGVFMALS
jgi:hypothetical protein